ncbi:MAG: PASTA domain-containing protein [Anaeroplasma sp.]
MKITKILWFMIGIIFILWTYYLFVSPNLFKPNVVTVPDLKGLSEEEAIKRIEGVNLSYSIIYIEGNSNSVDYSIPGEKTNVYEGHCIQLYIEYIPKEKYPLLEGLLYNDCENDINYLCDKYDIKLETNYIESDGIDNQIIYQSKTVNDDIIIGETLILTINKSNAYFQMPNIVGLNVEVALKELDDFNFRYSIVYYYAPIDEDIILEQEIKVGALLKRNVAHNLRIYVSKGMPESLDSLDISSFCHILNELNYNYDIIYVDSQIKDIIISFYFDIELNKYKIIITK